jgi:hypothetical protein
MEMAKLRDRMRIAVVSLDDKPDKAPGNNAICHLIQNF